MTPKKEAPRQTVWQSCRRRARHIAGLTACILGVSACSGTPTIEDLVPLEGSTWVAEYIGADPVIARSRSSILFVDDDRIRGNAGCNTYGATVDFDDEDLEITEIQSTKRACPPNLMRQETAFLRVLLQTRSYERDADILYLFANSEERTPLARLRLDVAQRY